MNDTHAHTAPVRCMDGEVRWLIRRWDPASGWWWWAGGGWSYRAQAVLFESEAAAGLGLAEVVM